MFGVDDLILGGLSFGGSLLSGLGARQAAQKQQKIEQAYEYQNYLIQEGINAHNRNLGETIRNNFAPAQIPIHAEQAGFNPVTWLGSMGGMYSAMQGMGYELMVPKPYFQNAPQTAVPSVMSAVGGAISAGTSTLASAHANTQRVDAANQSAMLSYLAGVQRARAGGNAMSGLGTPAFSSVAGQVISGGGAAAALSLGRAAIPKPSKLNEFGLEEKPGQASTPSLLTGDRSVSGAQTAQDAYDWPLSIPFGAVKFGADAYRSFTGRQFAGDFYADRADAFPPTMPTERGQAAQSERTRNAFGTGVPFFARNIPWARSVFGSGPDPDPFWANPYVFQ